MGIMTGGVVCPTAAKKCEVKLERLPTANGSNSATNSSSSSGKKLFLKFFLCQIENCTIYHSGPEIFKKVQAKKKTREIK